MSFFCIPLSKIPILSPATASSNYFLNVYILATAVFVGFLWNPTISIYWFGLIFPDYIVPVATTPLPPIVNESSIDNKNGLSTILSGNLSFVSIVSTSFIILGTPNYDLSLFKAKIALPLINVVFFPSY